MSAAAARAKGAGLVIEAATGHVEVLVTGGDGALLAELAEDVDHGHTRRLAGLVRAALERARVPARDLGWIAVDLGPGSFTGVRVGLATAQALALVSGAALCGASSLAALAHAAPATPGLLVPLVPAGRRDLYAGFFRVETRGGVALVQAPCVGPRELVLERAAEVRSVLGKAPVRFVGPGVARESEALERAHPGSTTPPWRAEGLSARDLAHAARLERGPAAGLPNPAGELEPVYVRAAQAEERVRRQALAGVPIAMRDMCLEDVPPVAVIERRVFSDPWPESFFVGELRQAGTWARVAEREGRLAGYSLAWLEAGGASGHLGNLAVAPEQRRRGVATALLDDLLAEAQRRETGSISLEVRVSNAAAQGLYRTRGFRVAGLRRRYYRDNGEDALVMEWRSPVSP